MADINWLRMVDILGAHAKSIQFSGGSDGIRDLGLLESALTRPRNIVAYEPEAPLARLAAAYGFGISANHPFVDGNKRTAFIAIELFLDLHDVSIDADEEQKYVTIMALAAGELNEDDLARWIEDHSVTRS